MRYSDLNIYIEDKHMIKCEDMLFNYKGFRNVALDLGAHVGTRSLWLATDGDFKKVYAVECEIRNFALLLKNIKKNSLEKNIIPILAAIDVENKLCRLVKCGLNSGQVSICFRTDVDRLNLKEKLYFMPTMTIAQLMKVINEPVDFIKCDLEGMEYKLFSDSKYSAWLQQIKGLFLEVHAPNDDYFSSEWLESLGYDPEMPNDRIIQELEKYGFSVEITKRGQIVATKE